LSIKVPFLSNLWYVAGLSTSLKSKALRRIMLCGQPVLLARSGSGKAFALKDICPHRAAPLSAGRFKNENIECPYHGWQFRADGICAHIPSILNDKDIDTSSIRIDAFPLKEQDGILWVYVPADLKNPSPIIEPPRIPIASANGNARPRFFESQLFPCEVDHAVVGLMDPSHGPFVHKAWWWRSERSIHEKAKHHVPSERGFTMVGHKPSSNSFAYRLLGSDLSTEIRFELPGLRFEHIRAGKREVLGFTAVTPLDETETLVTQLFYWTIPVLSLIKPILAPFVRTFISQDRKIVELQNEGLKFSPPQMLIQDADVPAIWYHRLRKAWAESVASGAPFDNPVQERVLRWRS